MVRSDQGTTRYERLQPDLAEGRPGPPEPPADIGSVTGALRPGRGGQVVDAVIVGDHILEKTYFGGQFGYY